ncbi:MAG: hypothetical protein NT003_01840 [Candidatus Magasanikbacteria bacterium]|nr:hypothetical protein [Candidatus Magasanikbacteria bacterium]
MSTVLSSRPRAIAFTALLLVLPFVVIALLGGFTSKPSESSQTAAAQSSKVQSANK